MRAARTDRKEVVEKVLRGLQCSTGSKGWVPRIVGWEGVDAEKCTYDWRARGYRAPVLHTVMTEEMEELDLGMQGTRREFPELR